MAAIGLLVLLGGCLSTDEQGASLRRVGPALGQTSGDSGACGNITFQGCCDGNTLYYCKSGQVLWVDCSTSPLCGWDSSAGWYDCGTAGQADPTGAYPKACVLDGTVPLPAYQLDAKVPAPASGPPYPCGDVTWEGCCHGRTLYYCAAGSLETIDCTKNPSCGWYPNAFYDCGTTGGADPSGTYPKACAFGVRVPGPTLNVGGPCGNLTWEGCCDGETLKYCKSGKTHKQSCATNPICGWDYMTVSYDCGTGGKADPSGTHPKDCAALLETVVPEVATLSPPCGNVTWRGCCHGELLYSCQNGGLQVEDCHRAPHCGWGWGAVPEALDHAKPGFYQCRSSGAADPTGLYPKDCDFGDAGPPLIGNTCGNLSWQGCCDGQILYYCDAGTLKWADCGKEPHCGWTIVGWRTGAPAGFYTCGTDGKADPSGQVLKPCRSTSQAPEALPGCGPVTHEGCCEGDTLYYCAAGVLKTLDCAEAPSCGWQEALRYYDCNTEGFEDPLGMHPKACGLDGGAPVLDQDQPTDAPPPTDQSIHDIAPAGDPAPIDDTGCGCALVPRSPGGVTLLLLLALVVTLRRRP